MSKSRFRAGSWLIAAVFVVGVSAIAVANGRESHHRIPYASVPRKLAARIAVNRSVLARSFPVLGSAHAASNGLAGIPEPFARELAQQSTKPVPPGGLGEPDPAMAVSAGLITTSARGQERAWVMPGPNDICLAALPTTNKGGNVSCQGDQIASEGNMIGWEAGPQGHSTLIGLAPGGAASVTVHETAGREKDVSTQDGVWVVNDDPSAVSVFVGSLNNTLPSPAAN